QMVEQVRGLAGEPCLVLRRRGDHGLDRLFAHLPGDLRDPFVEQPRRVGPRGPGAGPVGDGAREPGEGAPGRLPETGGLARVARRALLAHQVQHRVAVAIHADLLHRLGVSRRFALAPQGAARAAVIMGLAGGARLLQRRAVGVPHHEDFACEGALSDDGDESIVPEANSLNPICRAHAVKISALRRIVKMPLGWYVRHCGAWLEWIYNAS